MYGFLISFGILLAVLISEEIAKKENLDAGIIWEGLPLVIISAILGARIYHVLDLRSYYLQNPISILEIWKGGLGIIGGLILGGISLIIFLKVKKQPVIKWLNVISVSVPLAQAIGRMGNYFNKEIYGTGSIPFFAIEAILNVVLFLTLFYYFKKFQKNTFGIYLIGYGLIRFFLEFLREDSWRIININVAQIVCLLFIISGIVVLRTKNKMLQ